jgi:hypothetical protein
MTYFTVTCTVIKNLHPTRLASHVKFIPPAKHVNFGFIQDSRFVRILSGQDDVIINICERYFYFYGLLF